MTAKATHAIQKAGQSLHNATEALKAATAQFSVSVPLAVKDAPFSNETEHLMTAWRTCSQLTQEMTRLDARLAALYQELTSPSVSQTLSAAPLLLGVTPSVTDVTAKPASKVIKKAPLKAQKSKIKALVKPGNKKLPDNAKKLLTQLVKALNKDTFSSLNLSQVGADAGMPNGSIAASLDRLLGLNLVVAGEKGLYKLGEPYTEQAS